MLLSAHSTNPVSLGIFNEVIWGYGSCTQSFALATRGGFVDDVDVKERFVPADNRQRKQEHC
jgi:hypothetical protein